MLSRREFLAGASAMPICPLPYAAWLGQDPARQGVAIFDRIVAKILANRWQKLPIGDLMGKIGLEFLGTPYVGHTLELSEDREFCVVNLEGLDCVTFFENVLGIARAVKSWDSFERKATETPTFDELVRQVTYTRYRGGKLGDYSSRLHYTIDWFHDNDAKGVVRDLSESLPGAVRMDWPIDFMSAHVASYRQLKAHPALVARIREFEKEISDRERFYVPSSAVPAIETKLETGDIVGLVSTTAGLDINHTGLIVRDGVRARFLHASSLEKKVVLGPPIGEVLAASKRDRGLAVARPRF